MIRELRAMFIEATALALFVGTVGIWAAIAIVAMGGAP